MLKRKIELAKWLTLAAWIFLLSIAALFVFVGYLIWQLADYLFSTY